MTKFKIKPIKLRIYGHSIICTKCNHGWDLEEIKSEDRGSVYYICPECRGVLLVYDNKEQYKRVKRSVRKQVVV